MALAGAPLPRRQPLPRPRAHAARRVAAAPAGRLRRADGRPRERPVPPALLPDGGGPHVRPLPDAPLPRPRGQARDPVRPARPPVPGDRPRADPEPRGDAERVPEGGGPGGAAGRDRGWGGRHRGHALGDLRGRGDAPPGPARPPRRGRPLLRRGRDPLRHRAGRARRLRRERGAGGRGGPGRRHRAGLLRPALARLAPGRGRGAAPRRRGRPPPLRDGARLRHLGRRGPPPLLRLPHDAGGARLRPGGRPPHAAARGDPRRQGAGRAGGGAVDAPPHGLRDRARRDRRRRPPRRARRRRGRRADGRRGGPPRRHTPRAPPPRPGPLGRAPLSAGARRPRPRLVPGRRALGALDGRRLLGARHVAAPVGLAPRPRAGLARLAIAGLGADARRHPGPTGLPPSADVGARPGQGAVRPPQAGSAPARRRPRAGRGVGRRLLGRAARSARARRARRLLGATCPAASAPRGRSPRPRRSR